MKEIFLRELISNASDAIDKLKFNSLTDSEILGDDKDFKITLSVDKDKKELTITDNGIELIEGNHNPDYELIEFFGTRGWYAKTREWISY